MKKKVAHFDRDKCVGCGACAEECPRGVIALIPRKSKIQVACGIGQHTVIGFGCNGVECGIEVHDGDFIFQTLAVQSNAKLRGSFLGSGHNTVQTILIISALQFQLESRTEQPCGITKATAIYIATTRNINQIVIVCGFTIRIESVGIFRYVSSG